MKNYKYSRKIMLKKLDIFLANYLSYDKEAYLSASKLKDEWIEPLEPKKEKCKHDCTKEPFKTRPNLLSITYHYSNWDSSYFRDGSITAGNTREDYRTSQSESNIPEASKDYKKPHEWEYDGEDLEFKLCKCGIERKNPIHIKKEFNKDEFIELAKACKEIDTPEVPEKIDVSGEPILFNYRDIVDKFNQIIDYLERTKK